jgi:drug/metabolite transporter (DMT)-like permease
LPARYAALLTALAAVWGGSYLLIKIGLEDFEPGLIVWARCALAAVLLIAIMAWTRGGEDLRAAVAEVRARPGTAIVHGLLAITLPFLLITFGELEVPSGLTAVLLAPAPLWVSAFAPFVDHSERADARAGAGMVAALAGVALLVGVESVGSAGALAGALAILGASALYGASSLFVKRRYAGRSPLVTTSISVSVTAVLTLPIAMFSLPDHAPGAGPVAAVVALGFVGTALAFVAFYVLIARLGAARASLIAYLAPAAALVYGATLYDEAITVAALAGLALILGGVALAAVRRRPAVA